MNPNIANREVCNLIFCEYKTQKPFLYVDYANTTTSEITGESVFAYGGENHPKRIAFTGEKGGTISFETQIQTFKLWSLMTGADVETTASFLKREEVVCNVVDKLTVSAVPVAGTINVFNAADDCGKPIVGTATATSKEISLTGLQKDAKYIVYYTIEMTAGVQKLSIKNTTFPKAFTCYSETYVKSEADEIIPYKHIAYKCQPQPNISITYSNSGDPTSLKVTCDLLSPGNGKPMVDMILIEE